MLPSHALMLGGQIAIRKGQCSKRFFRSKGFYFEKFLFGKVIFPTGKFMEIHLIAKDFFYSESYNYERIYPEGSTF